MLGEELQMMAPDPVCGAMRSQCGLLSRMPDWSWALGSWAKWPWRMAGREGLQSGDRRSLDWRSRPRGPSGLEAVGSQCEEVEVAGLGEGRVKWASGAPLGGQRGECH